MTLKGRIALRDDQQYISYASFATKRQHCTLKGFHDVLGNCPGVRNWCDLGLVLVPVCCKGSALHSLGWLQSTMTREIW